MAAWDDRLVWRLFTGRCRYCGVECRGVTCAAHADLPRLELLPVQRCPRCEGYDMEYHTYRGECSADPNCPHGIAVERDLIYVGSDLLGYHGGRFRWFLGGVERTLGAAETRRLRETAQANIARLSACERKSPGAV